jgi:hypothetical protein
MPDVELRDAYVELLKNALTCSLWRGADGSVVGETSWLRKTILRQLRKRGLQLIKDVDEGVRSQGRDWPFKAHTMIGRERLNNLQQCVESVIKENVPGDLIETGVWRGGATILMRGILKAWHVTDRKVWVADSFEGLPRASLPQDASTPDLSGDTVLAVSQEEVMDNFRRYGLLDDQVQFLKGWFKDTLPDAPIQRLAVARLDGDMYESTMDAIVPLYPKLSVGGYLIIDDYHDWPGCKAAIDEYRSRHDITEPLHRIDVAGAYWRKESAN